MSFLQFLGVCGGILLWLICIGIIMVLASIWTEQFSQQTQPEYLPDGALVGYKWLTRHLEKINGQYVYQWKSPVQGTIWNNDTLTAKKPTMHNHYGVYVYYSESDAQRSSWRDSNHSLVKLACDGTIIYHEVGARVEHVQIIAVLD